MQFAVTPLVPTPFVPFRSGCAALATPAAPFSSDGKPLILLQVPYIVRKKCCVSGFHCFFERHVSRRRPWGHPSESALRGTFFPRRQLPPLQERPAASTAMARSSIKQASNGVYGVPSRGQSMTFRRPEKYTYRKRWLQDKYDLDNLTSTPTSTDLSILRIVV